jgi:hypothetical protein
MRSTVAETPVGLIFRFFPEGGRLSPRN